jgi:hypothetical protein
MDADNPRPLRFVVLRHTVPAAQGESHFDLMLERTGLDGLITYRSVRWPITETVTLTRLNNHRRAYLEYEGEISGGRGWVRRVAEGQYSVDSPRHSGAATTFQFITTDRRCSLRCEKALIDPEAPVGTLLPISPEPD